MATANVVNSRGLICDIIGALILWRYGLLEPISRRGAIYLVCEQSDDAEAAKGKRYDRIALWGIALLVVGFGIQLVSNFL
jgi:hypothetical protein